MRRGWMLVVLLALDTTSAAAKRPSVDAFAEPSDIITAEGAFLHLRTAKGPRAAMLATAQGDAQTSTPLPMRVSDTLKSRGEPALPPAWQPQQVWMSCDGSYAVSYGAWQKPPATGWYATVWHRQKSGSYKWVLDVGGPLAAPLPAPEMIAASVGDCPARHARPGRAPDSHSAPAMPDYTKGHADDGTLAWSASGGPGFVAQLKQNGSLHEVLRAGAAAPGG